MVVPRSSAAPRTPTPTARVVRRRRVGRCTARRRRLLLQIEEALSIWRPPEIALRRVGARGRSGPGVVTERIVTVADRALRELGDCLARRVPDLLERAEVLILDEVGERLLH